MDFLRTLFLTVAPSSPLSFDGSERANQDLETALHYLVSSHPTTCRLPMSSFIGARSYLEKRLCPPASHHLQVSTAGGLSSETCSPGQKVWLLRDIPLHVEFCKLAQRFISPFPITEVINQSAVWLQLPRTQCIPQITFQIFQLKPVAFSPLAPPPKPPPPP